MTAWPPRRVAARATEILRQEGIKSLWFKTLGETVYRRMLLFERPLDEPITAFEARLSVTISLLEPADVEAYVAFQPGADAADVYQRLAAGRWCFVARHDGRMVHACWVATGRVWIAYLGREIELAPDEAYTYESFTVAECRGKDICSERYSRMLRFLRSAGFRRTITAIMPENVLALRPHEKAGCHPLGVMGYVGIGSWRHEFRR